MEYLIAVSSEDGRIIGQHFGHTEEFHILTVEDNQRFYFAERRKVLSPCREGEHDHDRLAQTVGLLSDCKYVLSARIGRGAQEALQARGITPLEIIHFVDYAVRKVMLYDQKFK